MTDECMEAAMYRAYAVVFPDRIVRCCTEKKRCTECRKLKKPTILMTSDVILETIVFPVLAASPTGEIQLVTHLERQTNRKTAIIRDACAFLRTAVAYDIGCHKLK